MKLPDDKEIRLALARGYAADIRAYVERRLAKSKPKQPTVADICRRFMLSQADAVFCIEQGGNGLVVSSFAYIPPPKEQRDGSQGWGKVLLHTFHPQLAEDAPVGRRVVMIIDEVDG